MCTSIVEIVEAAGAGKTGDGWIELTHSVVSYDHPHHAVLEEAITIDFVNRALGPGARVAVELTLESAKELSAALARAIAAAEIQSPDPGKLAERWSQILELPVGRDPAGNASIKLDNASIRFVPEKDGRGEGLGGLAVVAVDRARLFAAAKKRGKRTGDNEVMICGMRFRAVWRLAVPSPVRHAACENDRKPRAGHPLPGGRGDI